MRTLIAAAALTFAALTTQSAVAQTGTGRYCLSNPSGAAMCSFQTMAQCEQAKLPASVQQCFDRSVLQGTVGSGSSSPSSPTGGASPPVGDAGQR